MKAFRSLEKHEGSGKPMLTFNPLKAINSTNPITLPCNGCIGCRLDRAESWAVRCHHEAQMHEFNSFVTLTYANEHLPESYSVSVREFQLFMKRLRKAIYPTKIRFFSCGEYGDLTLRPHYHAIIFGYGFPDRVFDRKNKHGQAFFTSETLSKAWPYGLSDLSDVTYQSARYVAGYVMKKIRGDKAASHYSRTHPVTGLTVQVEPEFSLQSTSPGIGSTWFDKFKTDAFPSDFLVVDGRHTSVPRYYFLKLREDEQEALKRKRKLKAAAPSKKANRTTERLRVREQVQAARIKSLKRDQL